KRCVQLLLTGGVGPGVGVGVGYARETKVCTGGVSESGVDPGRALREGHVLDGLEGAEAEARRRAGLDDAEDVRVEVLDTHQGSQEVAVAAQVGDVRPHKEARGPADGHRQVGVRAEVAVVAARHPGEDEAAHPQARQEGASTPDHRRAHDGVEGELLRGLQRVDQRLPQRARADRGGPEPHTEPGLLAYIDVRVDDGLLRRIITRVARRDGDAVADARVRRERQRIRLVARRVGHDGGRLPARAGGEDFGDRHLCHLMLSVDMGVCRDVPRPWWRSGRAWSPSRRLAGSGSPVCGSSLMRSAGARIYDV
ncbi:unnamed protein product, partial [Pelagomonas calceolata]